MYESIGCSNSGGKSGPGEKRQRFLWMCWMATQEGGRWEDDGTSVARAESDGKGKEKDGRKAGQPPPPRLAQCDAKDVNEKGRCVEKGIQEEGWAVGGESFYQALGYVSGGITQSRSESGEPNGQERGRADMHQKIEGKWWSEWARRSRVGSKRRLRRKREREREEEGVGAGWMDGCGFTQSEQRWPGSVTIHPLECTLFPPTDSPDFLPDAN
ncbi:hypothetical protein BO79DRAFT_233431 [Aspergillus costaricaensis CBS 115574]|uniref:Uncharacterized protein n=1 Tax=Aspergillus costaricaensis CBS 115574 TaxID=1448317 RepID=A0ACD1HZA9_9EURO|nr:hypothetical protein BO79DRAFT_233431 [Aspergillus costaricaensis CBS 115574]RAK83361.1 hypothetical protein BO79DRAFT_233431 [Aspergillus costaricaensis CBS 115574]